MGSGSRGAVPRRSSGGGPAPRPTIYQVAERAGVSKSLVSLVLRGSASVSEQRRKAVLDAIAELGYRPSAAASSLAGQRSRSVGVAIDDFENLWFVDLLRGLREVLDESGLHVSVADRHRSGDVAHDPLETFLSLRVEGLVVAMDLDASAALGDVPVVVAGRREGVPEGADLVAGDDTTGARLATDHLLALGHTAIGHLTGRGGAARMRRTAYVDAMTDAGLAPRVAGDGGATSEVDGYAAARALLSTWPDTTAIFAANDVMLLGALAALRDHGLAVPDDVSVVGYDNTPLAAARYLAFTTVDDRSLEVGRQVGRTLLARRADPSRSPQHTLLAPVLVRRTSTGPVPKGRRGGRR